MKQILTLLFVLGILFGCTTLKQTESTKGTTQKVKLPLGVVALDLKWTKDPQKKERNDALAPLGQQLFFDKRLSGNKTQSCASCHNPQFGFGDGLEKSKGSTGTLLHRHTPHLFNLAWSRTMFWDGRSPNLIHQATEPIFSIDEMNLPKEELILRLKAIRGYNKQFKKLFPGQGVTVENVGKAIAAYERQIIVTNTPFDRYIAGDAKAMNSKAVEGMFVFYEKANCAACHSGANFTDNQFHNIILPSNFTSKLKEFVKRIRNKHEQDNDKRFKADRGKWDLLSDSEKAKKENKKHKYSFKTPGLRNVAKTAPYMHHGKLKDLKEVVSHYRFVRILPGDTPNKIIKKFPNWQLHPALFGKNLNRQDRKNLVAFLESLSGTVNPKLLIRPRLPN